MTAALEQHDWSARLARRAQALGGGEITAILALAGATDVITFSGGFPVVVYLAVTAGPGMDLSEIIRSIRAIPEAEDMSVVTGGLDLLVRLRVRDHAHLRELLLTKIFQINGVQRTETFLSLADVEPDNFAAGMLDVMIGQKR